MDKDQACLQKISENDMQAFDLLFMHYYPRVKNFAFGLIKNEEAAKDIAQDVFMKVWNNRTKLAAIESFRSYLFRMTKNEIYDYYKKQITFENYIAEQNNKQEDSSDPEETIHANELELLIDIAIENMPPQRKKIFNMSRKEGLSNEEISIRLQISKRTVETHISQALSDLKKITHLISIFFL